MCPVNSAGPHPVFPPANSTPPPPRSRLYRIQESGEELIKEKPEMQELVRPKISELEDHFDQLETVTKQKGERLFDANRAVLYEQSCDDIDGWVDELETQIMHGDDTSDLASLNILMQKQQMIETQMAVKAKQVRSGRELAGDGLVDMFAVR